jgi:hypothetical protein
VLRKALGATRSRQRSAAVDGADDWPVYNQIVMEGHGQYRLALFIDRMVKAPPILAGLLAESYAQEIAAQPNISLLQLVCARAAAYEQQQGAAARNEQRPLLPSAARVSVGAPAFMQYPKLGRGRVPGKTQLEARCGADLLDMAEGSMPSHLTLPHIFTEVQHQQQFAAFAAELEDRRKTAEDMDKASKLKVRSELHQHALDHQQQRQLWETRARAAAKGGVLTPAAAALLQHLATPDINNKRTMSSTAWRVDSVWQAWK